MTEKTEKKKDSDLYKGHRERLKQKFLTTDCENIEDSRLLELLLTYAIPRIDVYPIAKRLLEKFGDLNAVLEAETEDLCEVDGVGMSTAVLIKLVPALVAKGILARSKRQRYDSFADIAGLAIDSYFGLETERALLITFDAKMMLVATTWISGLSPNECDIDEAVLAKALYQRNVTYAVIVHNHPGGRRTPSAEDERSFITLSNFANALNVKLLDMLIVVGQECYSATNRYIENEFEYHDLDEEMMPYLPSESFEK